NSRKSASRAAWTPRKRLASHRFLPVLNCIIIEDPFEVERRSSPDVPLTFWVSLWRQQLDVAGVSACTGAICLARDQPGREAVGAERRGKQVLEQLHDLGRLGAAAIGRPALDEGLGGQAGEVERHAEFPPELHGEAQVLERQ